MQRTTWHRLEAIPTLQQRDNYWKLVMQNISNNWHRTEVDGRQKCLSESDTERNKPLMREERERDTDSSQSVDT